MKLSDLKAGDGIWIEHFGRHPAIVLFVDAEAVQAIYGSSKARPHMDELCINDRSQAGRVLGFTTPTYFNATRIVVIRDASKIVRSVGKRCPPNIFEQLVNLAKGMIPRA